MGILLVCLIILICRKSNAQNNRVQPFEWMRTLCPVNSFEPVLDSNILDEHCDYKNIIIGIDGAAVVREYAISGEEDSYELHAIKDFYGGGCVEGIIPDWINPGIVTDKDLLFFGNRSLGSLVEGECYIVFNKLVIDLLTQQTEVNDAVDHDIGVILLYSGGAVLADDLKHFGYDPETVKLISSSVGCRAYELDENFGDIYGWYLIEVFRYDGSGPYRMEGFAILHCRPYGFSAENYMDIV